jgi:ADP-ribose pyrophosphatase
MDSTAGREPTIRSQAIFAGKIISLQVDEVQLPNGAVATREIVKHPGAVAIIACLNDRLLVVEQYRKPLERFQVEIPAGKLDGQEPPEVAAKRELHEETGYIANKVTHLHTMATSPGFADEVIHLYVAEDLQRDEANLDEDEFLTCEAITWAQAEQYLATGRICDAKTIVALYAWKQRIISGKWGIGSAK